MPYAHLRGSHVSVWHRIGDVVVTWQTGNLFVGPAIVCLPHRVLEITRWLTKSRRQALIPAVALAMLGASAYCPTSVLAQVAPRAGAANQGGAYTGLAPIRLLDTRMTGQALGVPPT